ncbi:MAG: hypothetical protein KA151_08575 [Piscinibacter sp.]|nr:hypothetical protein [Piscinibacter sp.]
MNALAMITRCVRECASARDDRGRWRQERRLADELRAAGDTETISTLTAKAAAEVGRAIAAMGVQP